MRKMCCKAALVAVSALLAACGGTASEGPYQATGIKIGEVTESGAIVWTRLTQRPERVVSELVRPPVRYRHAGADGLVEAPPWPATPEDWEPVVELPDGMSVQDLEGAAPGAPGQTRVLYRRADADDWQATAWQEVDTERDFTRQFAIAGLMPDSDYALRVEARAAAGRDVSSAVDGRLHTAPRADTPARVVFGSVTGQDYINKDRDDGYNIYPAMLDLGLDFFVHTGDILYYDLWAKNLELARWGWAQMYSLPTNVEFQRLVPTYFMKDDHDVWLNDAWPTQQSRFMGQFTFAQGQAVFLE
jgi:alkaline phosphatase D